MAERHLVGWFGDVFVWSAVIAKCGLLLCAAFQDSPAHIECLWLNFYHILDYSATGVYGDFVDRPTSLGRGASSEPTVRQMHHGSIGRTNNGHGMANGWGRTEHGK
ncbi:hypothetical protein F4859DRAFT_511851 [Xylaria cf. heliscus]|nr:hypothetical protein F4859DRAFT_511851 [Xylaria cf. heliscus]